MASRVNTRFLLIFGIVIVLIGGGVGAIALRAIRVSEEKLVENGKAAMAEGDYELAMQFFFRALGKDRTNPEYFDLAESALLKLRPDNVTMASKRYRDWIGLLQMRTRQDTTNADYHLRLLAALEDEARTIGHSTFWSPAVDAADQMYDKVLDGDPKRDYALAHLGIAIAHRLDVATDDEVARAIDGLEKVTASPPADMPDGLLDRSYAALIEIHRDTTIDDYRGGREASWRASLKATEETLAAAQEALPNGAFSGIAAVEFMVTKRDLLEQEVDPALLEARADKMLVDASASDDVFAVLRAIFALDQVGGWNAMVAGRAELERVVEENPERLHHKHVLALLVLSEEGEEGIDYDEAERLAREIFESEPLPVGVMSRHQHEIRIRGADTLFQIAMEQWEKEEVEAERDVRLAAARKAQAQMADLISEAVFDYRIPVSEGRLALAEDDFATAARKLEDAITRMEVPTALTLFNSAVALEGLGEIGLAQQRLEEAIAIQDEFRMRMLQARLQLRNGRIDDALETAQDTRRRFAMTENDQLALEALEDTLLRTKAASSADVNVDPIKQVLLDATKQHRSGDAVSARATLYRSLEDQGDDVRIYRALAILEVEEGNNDAAETLVEKALSLYPGDSRLRGIRASLGNDDVVDALTQVIRETYEDDGDFNIAIGIRLRAWEAGALRTAETREAEGDTEGAQTARDRAKEFGDRAQTHLEEAEKLAPDDPVLVEHHFQRALDNEDWQAAQMIVDSAQDPTHARYSVDDADGLLLEGRLHLARKDFDAAILAFEGADEINSYSSYVKRLLGVAQERAGRLTNALNSYAEAYARRPTDMATVIVYASLLAQTGDRIAALGLLRDARSIAPDNDLILSRWLELESELGNAEDAMDTRRMLYRENPANRLNALQLAAMLARTAPLPSQVRDGSGRAFDERRWSLLPPNRQQAFLAELRAAWLAESNEILDRLDEGGNMLDTAMVRAGLAREAGRPEDGDAVLESFIDEQPEDARSWQMYTALADHLAASGRLDEAIPVYDEAIAREDQESRDATIRAAAALFSAGRSAEAKTHFETVFGSRPSPGVAIRLAECSMRLQQFEEARRWIQEIEDGGWASDTSVLLLAQLYESEGAALLAAGDDASSQAKFDEQWAAIARAKEQYRNEAQPFIHDASAHLRQYQRDRDAAHLDAALDALAAAGRIRAADPEIMRARSRVLTARGDVDGAIGELSRRLERRPNDAATRRELIQLCMRTGRTNRAVEFATEAVEAFPNDLAWHRMLGDVRYQRNEFEGAVTAYSAAHTLKPDDLNILTNLISLILKLPASEYDRIFNTSNTGLLNNRRELVDDSPYFQSAIAVVLCSRNQAEDGLRIMADAYRQCREELAENPEDIRVLQAWFDNFALIYGRNMEDGEAFVMTLDDELDVYGRHWLGKAWAATQTTQGLERAVAHFDAAIALGPANDRQAEAIYRELGTVRYLQGDCARAADAFVRVVEFNRRDAGASNNLAFLYATCLNDAAAALPHAKHAVSLNPRNGAFLDTLGTVQLLLGQHDEAESNLRESILLQPTADNNLHLARLLVETGRGSQARTYLRKASELNPDRQTAEEIRQLLNEIG